MKKQLTLAAAVLLGAAFGAGFVNVVGVANAQTSAGRSEYKVIGASFAIGGYEEDLNRMGAAGWHYVGTLPIQGASTLIFEKSR